MALIDLIEISKKFGTKEILNKVSFSIQERERLAIIGKNGGGKSTLMKIIAGTLQADDGRRIIQNNINVQMLAQNPNFDENITVKEAIKQELKELYQALREYHELLEKLEDGDKESERKQDELVKFIESKDAWNIDNKIEQVLQAFKLKEFENRSVSSLSGGEKRRVALGALILKKPDIMLLDEPTNHLDVYMVKFLEDFLLASKQSIVFISHDRYFIDKLANRSLEIEDGKIRIFDGGYRTYLRRKQELMLSLAKSHETLVKQLKSEEEWLSRGVKARLKRNEGRKERILQMREAAKKNPSLIRKIKLELERANLSFNSSGNKENRKKMLFECKNLSKTLNNKILFKDFSARVLQGERIAIVGKNGSGKSTLLKILLGEMKPDSGEIKKGEIKIGYFDQSRSSLADDKTLLEIFCPNGGDRIDVRGKNYHVYGYLKNFLFPKEFLDQKIGSLSGGEKNRVALALLFTKEYDCLILDEPTNDLDIATINILEDYLLSFQGALLIVSHDRYFVDKLATKLWIFENSKIEIDHLSYSLYLEKEDELKEIADFEASLKEEEKILKVAKKASKLSYKENEILKKHPAKIEELEKIIEKINEDLSKPELYQELSFGELSKNLEEAKEKLALLEDEYLEVLAKEEEYKGEL